VTALGPHHHAAETGSGQLAKRARVNPAIFTPRLKTEVGRDGALRRPRRRA